jgi:hypothetical protein
MFIFRGARSIWWNSNICSRKPSALARVKSLSPDPSRNPLGTLCVSNWSRCGAVLILRLLAQPGHFGRVISPSSVARCWFCQRGLARRSWHGDLLQRGCAEILTRDLSQRSCQEISFREIEQRSYLQISYKDLAWRLQIETLCRDLARVEILYRDLAKRTGIANIFFIQSLSNYFT